MQHSTKHHDTIKFRGDLCDFTFQALQPKKVIRSSSLHSSLLRSPPHSLRRSLLNSYIRSLQNM